MRFTYFFLALTLVLSTIACKGKKTDKPEDKKETTTDNNNSSTTTTTTATLEAEWTLEAVNNEKTPIDMNITFGGDGKFSMVTKDGTVKGTYTKSSDGKKLMLKSEKGEDNWDIRTLSEKELVVFDNNPKNKAEYKFTR
jgi:hypothetical protein